MSKTSKAKTDAKSPTGGASLFDRLSSPTNLMHELGAIAYATAVIPLVLLAFAVLGRH